MTGKDFLTLAIAVAFFGFVVVHAGDDDGLRGLTVKEQMRDPNFWQNQYEPTPALTREQRDKILYPHLDEDLRNAKSGTLDAAGQRRLAGRMRVKAVEPYRVTRDDIELMKDAAAIIGPGDPIARGLWRLAERIEGNENGCIGEEER